MLIDACAAALRTRARYNLHAVHIEAERRGEEACWVMRCWCTGAQTATLAVLGWTQPRGLPPHGTLWRLLLRNIAVWSHLCSFK